MTFYSLPVLNQNTEYASQGLDYNKAVVSPIKQAAPLARIQSFDSFRKAGVDVVLMAGGIHYGRKPVSVHVNSLQNLFETFFL